MTKQNNGELTINLPNKDLASDKQHPDEGFLQAELESRREVLGTLGKLDVVSALVKKYVSEETPQNIKLTLFGDKATGHASDIESIHRSIELNKQIPHGPRIDGELTRLGVAMHYVLTPQYEQGSDTPPFNGGAWDIEPEILNTLRENMTPEVITLGKKIANEEIDLSEMEIPEDPDQYVSLISAIALAKVEETGVLHAPIELQAA